jgi:hypothetical protein
MEEWISAYDDEVKWMQVDRSAEILFRLGCTILVTGWNHGKDELNH